MFKFSSYQSKQSEVWKFKTGCIYLHLAWPERSTKFGFWLQCLARSSLCALVGKLFQSPNIPQYLSLQGFSKSNSFCLNISSLPKAGSPGPIRSQTFLQGEYSWKLYLELIFDPSLLQTLFWHFIYNTGYQKFLLMFFPLDCKLHQGRKYTDTCYGLTVYIAPTPQIHMLKF